MLKRYNYHTHSRWCKHATGELAELIEEALKNNMDILGMSPHIPTPGDQYVRMKKSEFDLFYQEFQMLKEEYKDKIELRLGLETEYLPQFFSYFDELIDNYDIDYVIFGHHFKLDTNTYYGFSEKKEDLYEYVENFKKGIQTGRYDFVAHPDVVFLSYPHNDEMVEYVAREIFSTCEAHNIPVEFNANGIRRGKVEKSFGEHYAYPWHEFWKYANDYKLRVLINSDNHSVDGLYDENMKLAHILAKELNLNIVDDYKEV